MAELLRPDRYPTHCSACRSANVIVDQQAGDVVCRSCGTVLKDRLEVDDSCTRLENTGGDVTRHRSYHFTAEVEGDVDVEALDSERKRKRFEDQSQWGRNAGPSATLEQLRAAESRRRRRVAEAQACMDALSDRLRLPDHVRARARSLLHDQAAPSEGLKAAASAARGVTQPGRASAAQACALVVWAARSSSYPLHVDDVSRACLVDIDARAIERATTALVEACGQKIGVDDAGRACQFVAVLGDCLARNRESTFALAPCDQSRAAAFSGVLETHFPRDDARRVAAAAIACVAFRDAPQLAKRGVAAQACLALAACVPGLRATEVSELVERVRKAGLAPPPKAGSNPSSPRPAASAPDLPRIDPYGAVKHVSPDSVVALHVDKPPENVEASPFDLGSVLSDSTFS